MSIKHLGINIREKYSNYITKESYLSAKPEGMRGWNESQYPKQIAAASLNYDMNMRYFESLDHDEFSKYISKKCKKFKLKECTDLNELIEVEGVYMMVLDNYKQVYIGISSNIKKRIMTHWNAKKSLERLIFGDICESGLSIDSFGALDTTRVFYRETNVLHNNEEKIVTDFDSRYTLNRTAGGVGSVDTYTDTSSSALLAVIANRRKKDLVPFVDGEELRNVFSESDLRFYLRLHPELAEIIISEQE